MKERIYSLDTFKSIAAFMVVILHFPMQVPLQQYISLISRVAVPFFFLVSGYFLYSSKENDSKLWKQFKKLLLIITVGNIAYFTYNILMTMINNIETGKSLFVGLSSQTSYLINQYFWWYNFRLAAHLWYVRALLYMIIVIFIMRNLMCKRIIKKLIPIAVCFDVILCKYAKTIFKTPFNRSVYEPFSKFVGVAFVFVLLGYFIREDMENKSKWLMRLLSFINKHKVLSIFITVLMVACNIFEYYLLTEHDLDVVPSNYLFTGFVVLSIFMILLANPTWGEHSVFHIIGKKYSLYIYMFHLIVGKIINKVLMTNRTYTYIKKIQPVIIYIITLALIIGISFLYHKVKLLFANNKV